MQRQTRCTIQLNLCQCHSLCKCIGVCVIVYVCVCDSCCFKLINQSRANFCKRCGRFAVFPQPPLVIWIWAANRCLVFGCVRNVVWCVCGYEVCACWFVVIQNLLFDTSQSCEIFLASKKRKSKVRKYLAGESSGFTQLFCTVFSIDTENRKIGKMCNLNTISFNRFVNNLALFSFCVWL